MTKEFEWIKKIATPIDGVNEIPLFGAPPPFPWEEFSQSLSKTLEIQDFSIESSEVRWLETDTLLSGLGDPLIPLNMNVLPFEGTLYWVMAKEDIKSLMSYLLIKSEKPSDLLDEEYIEGYYTFLALEAMRTIETLKFDARLKPQFIEDAKLPTEAMYAMDISFTIDEKVKKGRLLFSPELRQSIARFYKEKAEDQKLRSPLAEKLEVTLHFEVGSTTLTQKEWADVKPGDYILLEECMIQPGSPKGKMRITAGGQPFLRGRVKEGVVKILEQPFYHEEK